MNKNNVQFLDLNWQFMNQSEDKWYDAVVPGSIHLDLFQNQLSSQHPRPPPPGQRGGGKEDGGDRRADRGRGRKACRAGG